MMITATPARASLQASSACPSRERIFAAIQGECSQQEAEAIIKHASQCPACDQHWRDLCELSLEMAESVDHPGLSAQLRAAPPPKPRPRPVAKQRLNPHFHYPSGQNEPGTVKLFFAVAAFFLVLALFL